jgi:hypothetical protein
VALTSPGYLHSEYRRQELEWFHRKTGLEPQGLAVGDDYRICNLLLSRAACESGEGEPSAVGGEPSFVASLNSMSATKFDMCAEIVP